MDPPEQKRRWYRLHLSTWLVLLVAAAVLVLIVVPGERVQTIDEDSIKAWQSWVFPAGNTEFQHGWPFVYLRREAPWGMGKINGSFFAITPWAHKDFGSSTPSDAPWLSSEAWSHSSFVTEFRLWALIADVAVMLGILAGLAFALERRRKHRRVWQFSLRELLVFTALVACTLSWWQWHRTRCRHEDALISTLKQPPSAGKPILWNGEYSQKWGYHGPVWLRRLTGAEAVSEFFALERLNLRAISWPVDSSEFVPSLSKCSYLHTLRIWLYFDSPDRPLGSLDALSTVQRLELVVNGASVDDVAKLAEMTNLHVLTLGASGVDKTTLEGLTLLPHLEELELHNVYRPWPFGDRSLPGHNEIPLRLEPLVPAPGPILGSDRKPLRDVEYKAIGKLVHLCRLCIADCPITDADLVYLQSLKRLEYLELSAAHVTPEGVAELQRHLPDCEIEYDEDDNPGLEFGIGVR